MARARYAHQISEHRTIMAEKCDAARIGRMRRISIDGNVFALRGDISIKI